MRNSDVLTSAFLSDLPRDRLHVEFRACKPALRKFITGYNFYGIFGTGTQARELYMPAWTGFRFNWTDLPWWGAYKAGQEQNFGPSIILGPSVRNMSVHTPADGISLGFSVTPLGSARFLNQPISAVEGNIVDLAQLWPDASDIRSTIERLHDCDSVSQYLDTVLSAKMGPPSPDEMIIENLMGLLATDTDIGVAEISAALQCSLSKLRRISLVHFGFPLKIMLRRTRFMRSLADIYRQDRGNWARYIDESYHDQSHFIKDFRYFMGITPGEFIATPSPMTALSMLARSRALGAPVVALHRPAD